jgi:fumarylacetoacetate (FAA) hydrolase
VPRPPSVRDAYAFEEHIRNAARVRGRPGVPDEWYELPVFYFSNPAAIFGPDDEIPFPAGSEELDYELEVAAVIGAEGAIGGFTVMKRLVGARPPAQGDEGRPRARRRERTLRPPWARSSSRPTSSATCGSEMVARVNGEERSRGNMGDMYHSWEAIIERAATNTQLVPGDVIGSGTVGTGCILEHGDGRWLQPGDVVELEVEEIGVLRNVVGSKTS